MRKAAALLDLGKIDECERYLLEKIKEAEQDDNNTPLIILLVGLGELLFELGRIAEGANMLRRALNIHPIDRDLVTIERRRAEKILTLIEPTN